MNFLSKLLEKIKNRKFIAVVFTILILLSGSFLAWQNSKKIKKESAKIHLSSETDIAIVPTQKDASGVAPNSTFILSSKLPLERNILSQALKIFPETPFKIKEKDDQQWEIIPQKSLEKGKIYRFILSSLIANVHAQELTFAFQIKTPLSITGSLPRDQATQVPLNTSIEVYFNNPEFKDDPNFFEITPSVEGRFEKYQNTLVFLPKKLEPATVYTVKIKKDLSLKDNSEKLAEDFIFQFETDYEEKQPVNRFEFIRFLFESKPNQSALLLLENWEPPTTLTKARLYQLDQDHFLRCLRKYLNLPSWSRFAAFNLSCQKPTLPKIEFNLEPKRASLNGQYYFELPEALSSGFYLVEVENPNTTPSQALIEVTPLSWYYWIGGKESLFWINHLETQSPAGGSILSGEDKRFGQTDNNGLLKIQTPDEFKDKKNTLLTVKYGSEIAFIPVKFFTAFSSWNWSYSTSKNQIEANNFWSYLYLDRGIYLPNDKIHFWGLVKHREGQKINKIKAKLFKGYFPYYSDSDSQGREITIIEEKETDLSSFGTFIGNFELKNLPPDWYGLGIFVDNTLIRQVGFSVQTFQKPAYRISAQPERIAIWAGEKNTIKINASFWDGTPLSNTTLVWNLYPGNQKGEVKTNIVGEATFEIATSYYNQEYWPQFWNVNIHPKLPEEGEIKASTSFFVFGPKISLSGKAKRTNTQGEVLISAKRIDLDKIQNNPWEDKGDPIANLKIKTEVWRQWYEKVEIGEEYNPIEKTVEKRYRYDQKQEKVYEQELATNENGESSLSFSITKDQSYKIIFWAYDDQNREAKRTLYLWTGLQYPGSQEGFAINADKEKYKVGEKITLTLQNNGELATTGSPNRYLILGLQNGKILLSRLQNENQTEFEFQSSFIPNIFIKAIWFNGNTYQETQNWGKLRSNGLNLSYDNEERKLKIELKPEKKEYKPGGEAKIKITVTDPAGQPKKAKVLISSVDEALSDLGGIQPPNILSNLYRVLDEGNLLSYVSHPLPKMVPQTEGGGGGGGEAREKFENTPLFTEVETQENGQAEVNFKLPDNITTWCLSLAAVEKDLSAGEGRFLLSVTKPIFVRLITAEEFLVSDKPKLSLVAFGKILDENTSVNYKIKAPTLGIEEQSFTQKAFVPVEFSLPKMNLGEHKIEVWAEAKGQKDGLIHNIRIIESRLIREKAEFIELKKEFVPSWQTSKSVSIIVTDKSRAYWYPKLQSLANLSWFGKNERVDRLSVEMKAKDLLKQYFGEEVAIENDLARYQNPQGISLLPYGSEDLLLSAKIANLRPPRINEIKLKEYFWKIFNQEKSIEKASIALWGLAVLKEPVLNIINHLSNQENTPLGKLYLGLAAASLDDQVMARKVWSNLVNEFGVKEKPFTYLKIGGGKEEYIQATALGMVLASHLDQELAEEMWRFLEANPDKENIYVAEKLASIQSVLEKTIGESGSFEYWLGGKKVTKQLKAGQSQEILISPSQIKGFKIKPLSGNLGLVAYWWEKFDPEKIKKTPLIQVELNVNPEGRLSAEQIVEISLESKIDPNALEGGYLLAVNLPSGLRYIKSPYRWETGRSLSFHYSWPSFEEGNHLVFWYTPNEPVRFLARAVNKGNFLFEPAIIYHSTASDYLNLSPKPVNVTIE